MNRRESTQAMIMGAMIGGVSVQRVIVVIALVVLAATASATPSAAQRLGITHAAVGHEARLSSPAIVVDREGALVAWMAQEGSNNVVYVARPDGERVRVSPSTLSGDSLHQAPGLAVGPGGEVYVTWASRRPKPEAGLFASDLQLSRSLDGGRTFDPPLRVSNDTPTSHSFEGLAVAPDGTVLVAWVEARPGERPHTRLARVTERGGRVERTLQLDADETCVCCRVSVAAGAPDVVTVLWRKVFPGDVRDMVLARSRDGGRTVAAVTRVRIDSWRITACPHRGGSVAIDARTRKVPGTSPTCSTPPLPMASASACPSACTFPPHRFPITCGSPWAPWATRSSCGRTPRRSAAVSSCGRRRLADSAPSACCHRRSKRMLPT
jgi:hypothetical protein